MMDQVSLIEDKQLQQFYSDHVFTPFEYPQFLTLEPVSVIQVPKKQEKPKEFEQTVTSKWGFSSMELKRTQSNYRTQKPDINNFFSLCKMFFPQIAGENIQPLDIQIMDTIFYTPSDNPVYMYSDQKGICKLKNKNCCDFFLKRRSDLYQYKNNTEKKTQRSKRSNGPSSDRSIVSIENNLMQSLSSSNKPQNGNYVAVLKYKDDTCIRIKELQFKNIFYNPLHINQKLRNLHNTQWIQMLPYDDEKQVAVIDFSYKKFKDQILFQLARRLICEESSCSDRNLDTFEGKKLSKVIKQRLREYHPHVELYFITFQVYSYLSIHYSKKLQEASFYFSKNEKNTFILSNVTKIKIQSFSKGQEEFYRHSLMPSSSEKKVKIGNQNPGQILEDNWQNIGEVKQQENDEKQLSLLQQTILGYFDRENALVKKNLGTFINDKIEKIENKKDKKLSDMIFKTLNPDQNKQLSQMIGDDDKFYKFIKKKHQNQSYYSKSVNGSTFVHHKCQIKPKFTKNIDTKARTTSENKKTGSENTQQSNQKNRNLLKSSSKASSNKWNQFFQKSKYYKRKANAGTTQSKLSLMHRISKSSAVNLRSTQFPEGCKIKQSSVRV